jgi:hypothetical protein
MIRKLLSSVLVTLSFFAVEGCVATGGEDSVNEASQSFVTPCSTGLVTRTQGFWKNHPCVVKGDATGYSMLPVTLGASFVFDKPADVGAYLSTPPAGGNKQIAMGHQLLAAKLNVNAFAIGAIAYADWDGDGALESVDELIAIADGLYDSGSGANQNKMATILDKLNNAGDNEDLWFDPTCNSPVPSCD